MSCKVLRWHGGSKQGMTREDGAARPRVSALKPHQSNQDWLFSLALDLPRIMQITLRTQLSPSTQHFGISLDTPTLSYFGELAFTRLHTVL